MTPWPAGAKPCRWLRRWGWAHHIDAQIIEMDFGTWDGLPWSAIERDAFDHWWSTSFLHLPPGGGESVHALMQRAQGWKPPVRDESVALAVSHGGWMIARRWPLLGQPLPEHAAQWPAPQIGRAHV